MPIPAARGHVRVAREVQDAQLFENRFYAEIIASGRELMSSARMERAALSLLKTFESAGQPVSRVVVEGKKIELVLSEKQIGDEFDRIDMRHGKT